MVLSRCLIILLLFWACNLLADPTLAPAAATSNCDPIPDYFSQSVAVATPSPSTQSPRVSMASQQLPAKVQQSSSSSSIASTSQTSGIPMAGDADVKVHFDANGRPYTTASSGVNASGFSNMGHYEYLHRYLPNLKPSDVDRLTSPDLRNLYYKAIRAQGFSMNQAREMSEKITP
jgi:hypothetical protein